MILLRYLKKTSAVMVLLMAHFMGNVSFAGDSVDFGDEPIIGVARTAPATMEGFQDDIESPSLVFYNLAKFYCSKSGDSVKIIIRGVMEYLESEDKLSILAGMDKVSKGEYLKFYLPIMQVLIEEFSDDEVPELFLGVGGYWGEFELRILPFDSTNSKLHRKLPHYFTSQFRNYKRSDDNTFLGTISGRLGAESFETNVAPVSDQLARLGMTELGLSVIKIVETQLMSNLHILNISFCSLGENGARVLAQSENLGNLEDLDIRGNEIGLAGSIAICDSPHLESLKKLNLGENNIGSNGLEKLLGGRLITQIKGLGLSSNGIDDDGVATMTGKKWFGFTGKSGKYLYPRGKSLDLSFNEIGINGAIAIAKCTWMKHLEFLNLEGNWGIGREGADVLRGFPDFGRVDQEEYDKIAMYDSEYAMYDSEYAMDIY